MLTRARKLLETAPLSELEKADLYICHQGVVDASNRAKKDNTVANRREYRLAQEELEEAVRRFWPRHFPGEPLPAPETADGDDGGIWFRTKAAAFAWYADEGGQRQKSSFYAVVPCDGKRVSRLAVSEMLRKERRSEPAAADLSARKELAETEKVEAQAKRERLQAEILERKRSSMWIPRDVVYEREGDIVGRLASDLRYRAGRDAPALALACGGDVNRAVDLRAALDRMIFDCFRDFYIAGAIEIEYRPEDEEDDASEFPDLEETA